MSPPNYFEPVLLYLKPGPESTAKQPTASLVEADSVLHAPLDIFPHGSPSTIFFSISEAPFLVKFWIRRGVSPKYFSFSNIGLLLC